MIFLLIRAGNLSCASGVRDFFKSMNSCARVIDNSASSRERRRFERKR